MFGVIIVCAVTLLLYYIYQRKDTDLSGIPGPKPLPIVGNAPSLLKGKIFFRLEELAKQYGGIFKIYFLGTPIVVVSDEKFIHQVLVKQGSQFSGRTQQYRTDISSENQSGVVLVDAGPTHLGRKKAIQQYLKRFGTGIQKIEDVTQTVTDDLINKITQQAGQPMDMRDAIFQCITNTTTILLIGEPMEEKELVEFEESMDTAMKAFGRASGLLLDKFPFLRFFGNQTYKDIMQHVHFKNRCVKKWLLQQPDSGFVNFLQSLSEEEQKALCLDDFTSQSTTIWEFFSAGVHTTAVSTTTLYIMNVLCHYPVVQEELRQEVMAIIGPSRHPTLKDRENMPYLQACLLEIGRFASIIPFSLPHKAVRTGQLFEYTIPKDTGVWINLWTLHHSEKLWEEPFKFKPERFLDADRKLLPPDHPNRKNVMPFGAGIRMCPGEVMAVSRMFLIIARILQNFKILPETSLENQPSCDPREQTAGFVLTSPPFKIRLVQL